MKQLDFTYEMLEDCIIDTFWKNTFLDNLTPVHKKDERNGKENFRPVSSFSLLPKIVVGLTYD